MTDLPLHWVSVMLSTCSSAQDLPLLQQSPLSAAVDSPPAAHAQGSRARTHPACHPHHVAAASLQSRLACSSASLP